MDRRVLLLFAALAGGCAGESADSASPGPHIGSEARWGGQTGSLTPTCGLAQALEVQEGTRGFVIETDGCAGSGSSDIQVTDENGDAVMFTAISLGAGKFLVVPASGLGPGMYDVSVSGTTSDVTVVESGPRPTRVGDVTLLSSQDCGLALQLTLDPATLPYAPWLKISVLVDGWSTVYANYGDLSADEEAVPITCTGNCVSQGSHSIEVRAEIAGETLVLESATTTIESQCSRRPGSWGGGGVDTNEGCAMVSRSGSKTGVLVGGVILGLFAWRRSSARRVSRGDEGKGSGGRRTPPRSQRRNGRPWRRT